MSDAVKIEAWAVVTAEGLYGLYENENMANRCVAMFTDQAAKKVRLEAADRIEALEKENHILRNICARCDERIEALENEIARLKNPLPTEPPPLSAQGTQETRAAPKDAAP